MIRRYKLGSDLELQKRTLEMGLLSLMGPQTDTFGLEAEHANRRDGAMRIEVDLDLNIVVGQLGRRYARQSSVGRRELENIDLAEVLLRRRETGDDRRTVEHVGAKGIRFDALFGELGHDRLQLGGTTRQERDVEAASPEGFGDGEPHSGTCTDDGDNWHGVLLSTEKKGGHELLTKQALERVW